MDISLRPSPPPSWRPSPRPSLDVGPSWALGSRQPWLLGRAEGGGASGAPPAGRGGAAAVLRAVGRRAVLFVSAARLFDCPCMCLTHEPVRREGALCLPNMCDRDQQRATDSRRDRTYIRALASRATWPFWRNDPPTFIPIRLSECLVIPQTPCDRARGCVCAGERGPCLHGTLCPRLLCERGRGGRPHQGPPPTPTLRPCPPCIAFVDPFDRLTEGLSALRACPPSTAGCAGMLCCWLACSAADT